MCLTKFAVACFKKLTGAMDTARLKKKTPFTGVKTVCDIPYADDGSVYHLLDVYRPEEEGLLPVIIDIHGGAWVYGTKDINKHYCMGIAKQGFVVVNASYRLIPEGQFPKNIEDVFAAFDWTLKNIAAYGGDTDNIFLTGDSAGAHLAAMALSILSDNDLKEKLNIKTDITFRAVAFTCGVFDIEVYQKIKAFRKIEEMFFGKDYKNHPFRKNATIRYNKMESFPPLFLNSSNKDFMRKQVDAFAKECEKRGLTYEYKYFDKSVNKLTHVYSILYPEWEESIETTNAMLNFFRRYIKRD